jgi:hypothetical protein
LIRVEVIGKLPKEFADEPNIPRPVAMTDMQREALEVLAEVWALSPDVRFGQLMAHLDFLGETHVGKGLDYIEDDELTANLYRHRAELRARLEGTPTQALQPTASTIAEE